MHKKRILVVDDEEDLTWSISRRLSKSGKNKQFEIKCANSGKNALKMLSEEKIDLLLTDWRMPEISGNQLLNEVRENYPETKVVVMTAYGSGEIEEHLKTASNIGYIEKPFEMNDLRKLVFSVLL